MKYSAKEYAKALVQAPKVNVKGFLRLLERNGDTRKLKEIASLVEKIVLAKTGNHKIIVQTARKLDKKVSIGAAGDIVEEKINPKLVAGMKITVDGEKQLDFSMKHILESVFNT